MTTLQLMGEKAREVSFGLGAMLAPEKNKALLICADALIENMDAIIDANKKDIDNALSNGIKGALIDRLTLDKKRIKGMADGLKQVSALADPVGETVEGKTLPNGLVIYKKRVPMGVIGIIYEARPNVTAYAFGLCFK